MKIVEKREVWKSSEYEDMDSLCDKLISLVDSFIYWEKKNMDRREVNLTKDFLNSIKAFQKRVNIYGIEER